MARARKDVYADDMLSGYALMWMERRCGDPSLSIAVAAAQFGCNERTLRRALERDGGWRKNLLEVRMRRAEEKLVARPVLPISVVARACGFDSPTSFVAAFARQHQGLTPKQWRLAKGGPRRAGGATGAARQASARNRAREEGDLSPSMQRAPYRSTEWLIYQLEMDDAEGRAMDWRQRERLPRNCSIREMTKEVEREMSGPRGPGRRGRRRASGKRV